MRSNYIVIEGLEGAGKTTARDTVVETLKQCGIEEMIFTREPGGTQLAEKLRSLVLDIKSVGDEVITDKAEVMMFYAARVSWSKPSSNLRWRVGAGSSATATISPPRLTRAVAAALTRRCSPRCAMRCWGISART